MALNKTATIIQCTDSKVSDNPDEIFQAKNLYLESNYFRCMRDWAESRGDEWYILSAKHGLVAPNQLIAPYDECGISKSQAIEVALKLDAIGVDVVHISAGQDYTQYLIPELEQDGIDVIEHCAGMGIGERMKKLKDLATGERNESLHCE